MKLRGLILSKALMFGALCILNINIGLATNILPSPLTGVNESTSGFILINEADITFKMKQKDYSLILTNISYNEKNKNLSFEAIKEINFVQILNEYHELIFQVPVFSKQLHLNIDDLEMGQYHIQLVTTGPYMVIPAEILKKY